MRLTLAARALCSALAAAPLLVAACSGADPAGPAPDTNAARLYMTEALDLMHRNSINRYRIDWTRFRADALARVGAARTPAEAYPAVVTTVRALGDRHSGFYPPSNLPGTTNAPPTATSQPSGRMLDARIAYLFVPAFSGTNPVGRADSTQAIVRALDTAGAEPPCGWIVDLRRNGGGNMYPMVAGVGPLLGGGLAGSFVNPDSVRTGWFYRAGRSGVVTASGEQALVTVTAPYQLRRPDPPVAVLYGPGTASSGEATAISFRARPGARSFGAPTFGVSTANAGFRMSDGALLNLTVSVMADRTGRLYGDAVPPDEVVAGPAAPVPGEIDDVVRAAMRWLGAQPACAPPPPVTAAPPPPASP